MQRQFTFDPVDLYLIPIPTPPTPSLCQPDLWQFTFSPHDIPPVPVPGTANRRATRPYLFYARTGRNQAQILAPRQLPYFTHQIPPVPYVISLATVPPTSATHDVCRIIEGLCTVIPQFCDRRFSTGREPATGEIQAHSQRQRQTQNGNESNQPLTRKRGIKPSQQDPPSDSSRRPKARRR